jgi:hypothetical protein
LGFFIKYKKISEISELSPMKYSKISEYFSLTSDEIGAFFFTKIPFVWVELGFFLSSSGENSPKQKRYQSHQISYPVSAHHPPHPQNFDFTKVVNVLLRKHILH